MTKQIKSQQLSDHDLLVRLDTKVDQLSADIKEVKDGTSAKLSDHEVRIFNIEKVHIEVNPEEAKKKLDNLHQRMNDFDFRWKITLVSIFGLGGLITWVLLNLNHLKNLIK